MKPLKSLLESLLTVGILPLTFISYLYLSSPGEVVVDRHGEVVGLLNSARAQLQGSAFWRDLLREAKRELEWKRAAPERNAERQARLDAFLEKSKQRMDEFYKRHPEARPSDATDRAEALRERADDIEQAEIDEDLEKLRLKRLFELETIIHIIEARAS